MRINNLHGCKQKEMKSDNKASEFVDISVSIMRSKTKRMANHKKRWRSQEDIHSN